MLLRHPTNLDNLRARALTVLSVGVGGGCLDSFSLIIYITSFSFSLSLGDGTI